MSSTSETGIILYQNHLTDEMVSFLNGKDGGWTKASKKFEAVKAHLECGGINGSDNWKPEYFVHYKAVAKIMTDDVEKTFGIGNAFGGLHSDMVDQGLIIPLIPQLERANGRKTPNMHSMSVGDICQKGKEFFMCHRVGFTKIDVVKEMPDDIIEQFIKDIDALNEELELQIKKKGDEFTTLEGDLD